MIIFAWKIFLKVYFESIFVKIFLRCILKKEKAYAIMPLGINVVDIP